MKLLRLFFIVAGMAACQQADDSPCFTPPEPFRMVLMDSNGNDLLIPYRETSEVPRLYYLSQGTETSIPFDIREGNPSGRGGLKKGSYYLQSVDLPWLSFEGKAKIFYLERAHVTDTLEVEMGRTDFGGQCQAFYEEVAFNRKEVNIDSTDQVYVMRR